MEIKTNYIDTLVGMKKTYSMINRKLLDGLVPNTLFIYLYAYTRIDAYIMRIMVITTLPLSFCIWQILYIRRKL